MLFELTLPYIWVIVHPSTIPPNLYILNWTYPIVLVKLEQHKSAVGLKSMLYVISIIVKSKLDHLLFTFSNLSWSEMVLKDEILKAAAISAWFMCRQRTL